MMKLDRFDRVVSQTALVSFIVPCLFTAGCSIGPKYQRPTIQTAPAYKELDTPSWRTAVESGEVFQDPQLNMVENRLDAGNQTIAAAAANYAAARAVVKQTRSQYFPTLTTAPAINNSRLAASPCRWWRSPFRSKPKMVCHGIDRPTRLPK